MNKPWFDPETGLLLLDEYVAEMPSFQKITADQLVTDEEFTEHAHRVVNLLKALEETFSPEQKSLATDALCELAVLYALARIRTMQK